MQEEVVGMQLFEEMEKEGWKRWDEGKRRQEKGWVGWKKGWKNNTAQNEIREEECKRRMKEQYMQ